MFSEQQLSCIVQQITENYKNEDIFYIKNGQCMPDRDCIIHIMLRLRQIMFPGYFDDEYLGRTIPEYFVGHNILRLYDDLSCQIKSAFIQVSQENIPEKEIEQKTKRNLYKLFLITWNYTEIPG